MTLSTRVTVSMMEREISELSFVEVSSLRLAREVKDEIHEPLDLLTWGTREG